jgi:hypothetical protein
MPEPTTPLAASTLASTAATIPALTAFGVPLGIRADMLIAGFFGAVCWIILLKTMPAADDTWRELLRTSARRMAVAAASALTAGYLTPIVAGAISFEPLLVGLAFVVGAGAQGFLSRIVRQQQGSIGQEG